jgi:hypothetical protein
MSNPARCPPVPAPSAAFCSSLPLSNPLGRPHVFFIASWPLQNHLVTLETIKVGICVYINCFHATAEARRNEAFRRWPGGCIGGGDSIPDRGHVSKGSIAMFEFDVAAGAKMPAEHGHDARTAPLHPPICHPFLRSTDPARTQDSARVSVRANNPAIRPCAHTNSRFQLASTFSISDAEESCFQSPHRISLIYNCSTRRRQPMDSRAP